MLMDMCDHDMLSKHDFNRQNNIALKLLFVFAIVFKMLFSLTVSAISRDELDRIGRCTGSSVLLEFCSQYDVTDIPGQQSPGGKELLFETKIINVLKPKLDSEHEKFHKDAWIFKKTPREILRQLFPDKYSQYGKVFYRNMSMLPCRT